MGRTREEVREDAMQLSDDDRLDLAEELVGSVECSALWWDAWTQEATRRYAALESGADRGLTIDEFWSDEA
jgi:putative addiction module component (TIGR02574 family)